MDLQPYLPKFFYTAIIVVVFIVIRYSSVHLINQYAKKKERLEQRTRLVVKYLDFGFFFGIVFLSVLIWGINFKDIGLVFSSVFAVIGVALFAQWSILSNVTSGIIMFFTFPYKIGDVIKIHDKDFINDPLIIEDIHAFQVILRSKEGEILSYPNNMILQKGITLVSASITHIQNTDGEDKNLSETHD